MNKKDLVVVALATFCLTSTLFMILPSRSIDKDPWADVTGPTRGVPDNTVNMRDINYLIQRFNENETGVPRDVWLKGYSSNVSLQTVDIPPHSMTSLSIPTEGYQHADIGFWNTTGVSPVNARVGFLIDQRYSNVETFDLPAYTVPASLPWYGNMMWIDAPSTTGSVGSTFIVTVWLRYDYQYSTGWQAALKWDPNVIGYQGFGFGNWADQSIPPENTLYNGSSVEPGFFLAYELFYGAYVPPTTASLFWIEFETLSPYFETQVELGWIGIDTFVLDNYGSDITFQAFNSVLTKDYMINKFDIEKSYDIAGPTMTIELINPNDYNAVIHVEVFLTTAPSGSSASNETATSNVNITDFRHSTFEEETVRILEPSYSHHSAYGEISTEGFDRISLSVVSNMTIDVLLYWEVANTFIDEIYQTNQSLIFKGEVQGHSLRWMVRNPLPSNDTAYVKIAYFETT